MIHYQHLPLHQKQVIQARDEDGVLAGDNQFNEEEDGIYFWMLDTQILKADTGMTL